MFRGPKGVDLCAFPDLDLLRTTGPARPERTITAPRSGNSSRLNRDHHLHRPHDPSPVGSCGFDRSRDPLRPQADGPRPFPDVLAARPHPLGRCGRRGVLRPFSERQEQGRCRLPRYPNAARERSCAPSPPQRDTPRSRALPQMLEDRVRAGALACEACTEKRAATGPRIKGKRNKPPPIDGDKGNRGYNRHTELRGCAGTPIEPRAAAPAHKACWHIYDGYDTHYK